MQSDLNVFGRRSVAEVKVSSIRYECVDVAAGRVLLGADGAGGGGCLQSARAAAAHGYSAAVNTPRAPQ